MKVSIIIPNWNGKKFIKICLDSVLKSDYQDFEIIVVDNGSTDGSKEQVLHEYVINIAEVVRQRDDGYQPKVHQVRLPANMGFARACNEGIYNAQGEYIILLNNDIEVEPNWLRELVEGMERHPECSMGTSKMIQYDNRSQIYNTGDLFRIWCTGGGRGFGEVDTGQYEEEDYVFGACAGAGIYRKSLFEKIGYFDEDFFIFSEDVDINIRMQRIGERCIYLPKAVVYHWGTATVGFNSTRHVFLAVRNDLFVLVKNYSLREMFANVKLIYKKKIETIRLVSNDGHGFAAFKALISFLYFYPKMVYKRMSLALQAKKSLDEMEEVIKE